MKDGYRYFSSRPTAADGNPVPVESSKTDFFRVFDPDPKIIMLPIYAQAEFRDGKKWVPSAVQPFRFYLDDVLGSGATIRELLDEKDIPRA